jgi:XTP/dITP diphosphohydrolase
LTKVGGKNIIVVVTENHGKLGEIRDLLHGEGYILISLAEYHHILPIDETGKTVEDNARKKAVEGAKQTGHITLADDTSLEIEALNGDPGVHAKRFLGLGATQEERNWKILELMRDVRGEKRKARFRCAIAIAQPDGTFHLVQGECNGLIAERPRGKRGFGYDPIFYVPRSGKTMAEMDPVVKNRISHRGRAMERAKGVLREIFKGEEKKSGDPKGESD